MTAVNSMSFRPRKNAASSGLRHNRGQFFQPRPNLTVAAEVAAEVGDMRTTMAVVDSMVVDRHMARRNRVSTVMGISMGRSFRVMHSRPNTFCMTSFINKYKSSRPSNRSCACNSRTRLF